MRRLPSNDMTFAIARTVADEIRAAVGRGAAGVVVTQGTDTIEEMAYAWDLLVAGDAPTVVTGAMRHAALASADGAGNLLDAVRTAASPQARGLGCLVVLNEEIHSARAVRKSHTSSLAAFRSAGVGPLGWIAEGEPRLRERPYAADLRGAAARTPRWCGRRWCRSPWTTTAGGCPRWRRRPGWSWRAPAAGTCPVG